MQWVLQALYISFGDDPQGPLVIPGDAIAKSEKKKHKLQEDLILDRAYVVRLASPLMFGVDFDADAWLRATERIKEADADRVAYRASEDVSKKLPVWSKRAVKWAWSRMRELSGEDRPKERRTPSTTAEARGRLDEVVAWCEKMMQKSKPHGASGGTIFTNTEQSGLENRWPKSTGWDFVPGKVAFNGKELEIKGIKWKLLQRLATAHVAVTADELKVAGWGEENQADNNGLRYQLCELRKMLRHALGLGKADDPIPKVDRGNLGAWQLSENLRKT
ncbi:MAG: hypothetical protein GXY83_37985 [Rhodopirellula sp.]|nr:hypothetical protein [Rhodopirellula sp.]